MKTFMQKFSLITPLFSEQKPLMPFYSLENNAQRLTKSLTSLTDWQNDRLTDWQMQAKPIVLRFHR